MMTMEAPGRMLLAPPAPKTAPRTGCPAMDRPLRIVCLSDTHDLHERLTVPDGDVLLHAGDLSMRGTADQIRALDAWLGSLPHPHKVVIAGNHDWLFERDPRRARALLRNAIYLQDEGAEVAGLSIWGSPWQPWFYDWAFNLPRGPELAAKWARIPDGVDVLLTHGPPAGVPDRNADGDETGCVDVGQAGARVRPRLHVFGHIHEGHGRCEREGTQFVNAANCTLDDEASQAQAVVELTRR